MTQLAQLQSRLQQHPGDWDLRADIVEILVRQGELDAARKLVRQAPSSPVPYHVQKRFWNALAPSSGITVEQGPGSKPILKARARTVLPESSPGRSRPAKPAHAPVRRSLPRTPSARPRRIKTRSAPVPRRGRLRLVSLGDLPPAAARPRGRLTLASLAATLFAHLLLALLLSMVAVQSYVHLSPPVTVTLAPAPDTAEEPLEPQAMLREKPNLPSQAGASFLVAMADAPAALPSVQNVERNTNLNLLDPGLGVSKGLSFEVAGAESSVNFFGISRGGQSMVFLVEASPHMLLDEKGGMYAYDKVKQEIASLLQTLQRGTAFNLILFDENRLQLFQNKPVLALPSMVRRAIEWLEPFNRDYGNLGLPFDSSPAPLQPGIKPIQTPDLSHYTKAIQAALDQKANTIFCITSGWRDLPRSLSPEDQAKLEEALRKRRQDADQVDPADLEKWRQAQEKARAWLLRENEARAAKGLAPKVVVDFGALVRKLSPGVNPPRRSNADDIGVQLPPPYTPEEVEEHLHNVVLANYGKDKASQPSINLVLFLGEDESTKTASATGAYEKHFIDLTRRHKGQLKILHGLAALEDVTSAP